MRKITVIAALAATTLLASCGNVPESSAQRALGALGVKDVTIEGYAWWGCDKGDRFRSHFVGTGADGQRVTGVVCSGLFKGVTVRFD